MKKLSYKAIKNDGTFKISSISPLKFYLEYFCFYSKLLNYKESKIRSDKFLRKNLVF